MSRESSVPCLIVGAGISGLMAARELARSSVTTIIVDKAREAGGRMASARLDRGLCDHGAQFFTVKTREFRPLLDEAASRGLVERWSDGFPDAEGTLPGARHSRFRAVPAMSAIPKWLAEGRDVRLGWEVAAVTHDGARWVVTNDAGETIRAGALFLSAPLPQSLALLDSSLLPSTESAELGAFAYHPCFCLMLRLAGDSLVPEPGGLYPFLQQEQEPLAWIADNWKKGVSPDVTTLTLLAGHEFSRRHFETDAADVERWMIEAALPWIGSEIVERRLLRWRNAEPVRPFPEVFRRSSHPAPLYFIGDAFGGARIEGAARSGLLAARDYVFGSLSKK